MNTERNSRLTSIYQPLRITFAIVPILAGLDKFFNLLVDWKSYLPSAATDLLPVPAQTFMQGVGVIEIVAGLIILVGFVQLGAYVVMAWLVAIAIVVASAGHFDIAVRDLVMAVGAFSLGQAAALRGEEWIPKAKQTDGVNAHASAA